MLMGTAAALTGIALLTVEPATAKGRSAREDWFYQEMPDTSGKMCRICANFTAKDAGSYGADSGACALIDGDISGRGYCRAFSVNPLYGAR